MYSKYARKLMKANSDTNERLDLVVGRLDEMNERFAAEVAALVVALTARQQQQQQQDDAVMPPVTASRVPLVSDEDSAAAAQSNAPPNAHPQEEQQQRQPPTRPPRKLKFVNFCEDDCDGWFGVLEQLMLMHHIEEDSDKYDTLLAHLGPRHLASLATFTGNLHSHQHPNKYHALKTRLLNRYALSSELRLEKLFYEPPPYSRPEDTRRPSQVLSDMLSLAGSELRRDTLMLLWRKRLPEAISLAIVDDGNNDEAVEHADSIFELCRDDIVAAAGARVDDHRADDDADRVGSDGSSVIEHPPLLSDDDDEDDDDWLIVKQALIGSSTEDCSYRPPADEQQQQRGASRDNGEKRSSSSGAPSYNTCKNKRKRSRKAKKAKKK